MNTSENSLKKRKILLQKVVARGFFNQNYLLFLK